MKLLSLVPFAALTSLVFACGNEKPSSEKASTSASKHERGPSEGNTKTPPPASGILVDCRAAGTNYRLYVDGGDELTGVFYDDTGEFKAASLAADLVKLETSPLGVSLIVEGGRLSGTVHRPVLNASGGLDVERLGPDIVSLDIATKPEGTVTLVGRDATGEKHFLQSRNCRVDSELLESIQAHLPHSARQGEKGDRDLP